MLYFQRWEILRSLGDLSTADAHWKPHPEANSLIGIVSHLAWVERLWFHSIVGGGPRDDREPAFDVDTEQTPEAVTAAYVAALTRSNEIWDASELDQTFDSDEGRVSLRWIVNHMIEETAATPATQTSPANSSTARRRRRTARS
jgi:uncharacterized damage-inducible protein DinB